MLNTTHNMGQESFVWFVAIVEDIVDPDMLGRVKIRVINDHEGVDKKDLLWATLLLPPIYGFVKDSGGRSPTGLAEGSQVFGFYMDGKEKQFPIIWGTFAKMPKKDPKNNEVPKRAREINEIEEDRVGPEPKSAYNAKYPYNHVWQTLAGHIIEVDDTPGQERINIRHNSGTYTEVNHDGQRVDKTVDDSYEIVVKDKTLYVKGDLTIEVMGDAKLTVHGDATAKISGDSSVTVEGDSSISVDGNTNITANKEVNMTIANDFNGSAVNWNFDGNIALDGGEL